MFMSRSKMKVNWLCEPAWAWLWVSGLYKIFNFFCLSPQWWTASNRSIVKLDRSGCDFILFLGLIMKVEFFNDEATILPDNKIISPFYGVMIFSSPIWKCNILNHWLWKYPQKEVISFYFSFFYKISRDFNDIDCWQWL